MSLKAHKPRAPRGVSQPEVILIELSPGVLRHDTTRCPCRGCAFVRSLHDAPAFIKKAAKGAKR